MTKREKLLSEVASASPIRDSEAQDAVTVKVTYSVDNAEIALLKVDGHAVRRDAQGKASVKLRPGPHLVEWRAYCAPNLRYVVSIDSPDRVKYTPPVPLESDSSGFIANERTFTL